MTVARLLVTLSIIPLIYWIHRYSNFGISAEPSIFKPGSLSDLIDQDLHTLEKKSAFPSAIKQLKEVFLLDHRNEKTPIEWPQLSIRHFPKMNNGQYFLQIEVFNAVSANEDRFPRETIVQMNLYRAQDRNKIWELGRTYPEKKAKKNPN